MLPLQFFGFRSLVLYGVAAPGAFVAMFCIAVTMLLSWFVVLLTALIISTRTWAATAALAFAVTLWQRVLSELICKRLDICGSDHVFLLASTISELLDQRLASMRNGMWIL